MQADANTSPAFSPPRASAPQSITRAPESSVVTVVSVIVRVGGDRVDQSRDPLVH